MVPLVDSSWVHSPGNDDTKSATGRRFLVLPGFVERDLERHLAWYAEKDPNGLQFVGEKGAPFRRSSFGRKWRRARTKVGLPDNFRFHGATLKDPMVRAGQSSEKAALIYQHSTGNVRWRPPRDRRSRTHGAGEGQEA